MFIAMNRFHVKKGAEKDVEQVWLSRDTHLTAVPGFYRVSSAERTRARGLQGG
jgi:heme-degrading monooxygenase HmoA